MLCRGEHRIEEGLTWFGTLSGQGTHFSEASGPIAGAKHVTHRNSPQAISRSTESLTTGPRAYAQRLTHFAASGMLTFFNIESCESG